MKKPQFAVLGSTRGSSLVPILKAWKQGSLNSEPILVLSNRKNAGILEKGKEAGIESMWIPLQGRDRESYDIATSNELKKRGVDFVLLIGYMRILSAAFVNEWPNKIANVHPSLLPKYGGMMDMDIHNAVIEAGDCETGCSVHIVNEEVDGGPIIIQKKCPVVAGESAEALKARVQSFEGKAFLELLGNPASYLDV